MTSVNFILGKRERKPIDRIKLDTYPYRYSRLENGEGNETFPYRKSGQYSYKTDRDFEQEVGKLYKGVIEDEDILQKEQSRTALTKKLTPSMPLRRK